MKKNILLPLIYMIIILFTIKLTSCKKFLQVQPRDYMFEEEAFSSEQGIESVLNGFYQTMSDSVLYGNQLTLLVSEQLAQYYTNSSTSGTQDFIGYDYKHNSTIPLIEAIWKNSYSFIFRINNFCSQLEDPNFNILPDEKKDILLGEAYALRAFMYFDLMRLYGPIYSKYPNQNSIPYIKKVERSAQSILPASQVINGIIEDLENAIELLKNDPILINSSSLSVTTLNNQSLDYYSNRKRRMNYYSTKVLLARVLLYAGEKTKTWENISSIIDKMDGFFPWAKSNDFISDPLLSSESFFGIENRELYNYHRNLFSHLLPDNLIYTPKEPLLNKIYTNTSDYRYMYWFKIGLEGNKTYKIFNKFNNSSTVNNSILYYQPLIRKAEVYLIAAETAPNLDQGYSYLNTLRTIRGIPPIEYNNNSTINELLTAIKEEYIREFIGEGQTFFMFKRLNTLSINHHTGASTYPMNDLTYTFPLPSDELYYRN